MSLCYNMLSKDNYVSIIALQADKDSGAHDEMSKYNRS